MKKIYCVIVVCLSFAACQLEAPKTTLPESMQDRMPETWQEQVEFAKKTTAQLVSQGKGDLKFVDYNYLGKITSQEQLDDCWKRLLGDDTQVVMFPNKDDYETFDIVPLKQERERIRNLEKRDYVKGFRELLDTVVTIGKEMMELEWEYKGKPVHSLAILSHGKIVFDHIGTAVSVPGSRTPKKPVVKTRVYKSEEEMLQRIKEIKEKK